MPSLPDRAALKRAIEALVEDGSIRLDGEYIVWQSAVYGLIDCVFSAQANYSGTVLPMLRDRMARRLPDQPDLTLSAFMADVDSLGAKKFVHYARKVLTRQRLARRLKVEVCYDAAQFFVARGLERKGDFLVLTSAALEALLLEDVRKAVRGIGPTLARYLLMLLGREDHIKPDIMITRFFAALGDWTPRYGHAADAEIMREVVGAVAVAAGTTAARLDHAIWQYQRERQRGSRRDVKSVRSRRRPWR